MERNRVIISDCDTDIVINIEGESKQKDGSDLLVNAIVNMMEELDLEDNLDMADFESKIFKSFCDLIKRNHQYPEEFTNKEIIKDYMTRYIDKA